MMAKRLLLLYQVGIQRTGWAGLQLSGFRARSTAKFGVILVIAEVCFDDQFAVGKKLIVRTRRMDEHSCNVKKGQFNCRLTLMCVKNMYSF